MNNCPYCGTILKKTNWDRYWCPNCGIIDNEEEIDDEKERDYIN